MSKNAYAKAGVDVEAGYESVERMKKHVARTERTGMMGALGGFGGVFDLSVLDVKEPVLVSGTDGVGTKLLVAIKEEKHDMIGIDCVAMCVNDILAQGAQPLYFLDYIATGKTDPERMEAIVSGVAEGCVQAGAGLIGGETAEMPDMYGADEYDLAGFAVGVAEKEHLLHPEKIEEGNVLIGIGSSGIHSNGYSLVRKVFFEQQSFKLSDTFEELSGKTLGEELLEPTKIYVKAVMPLIQVGMVNGISHVTGGGFVENLPRMLPEHLGVTIEKGTWEIPAIFNLIQQYGEIAEEEMFEIFNMGIGMVLAVSEEHVENVINKIEEAGERASRIGKVVKREGNGAITID